MCSWSSVGSVVKKSRIELSVLTDIDQVLFLEREMRGGLATFVNPYTGVNNEYMGDLHRKPTRNVYFVFIYQRIIFLEYDAKI